MGLRAISFRVLISHGLAWICAGTCAPLMAQSTLRLAILTEEASDDAKPEPDLQPKAAASEEEPSAANVPGDEPAQPDSTIRGEASETGSPREALPPAELPSLTPLTAEQVALRDQLRKVLATYYPKHLDARQRSCWEVMHGIIAYGVHAKVFRNDRGTQAVNAIGWMSYNKLCHGETLFHLDRGKLVPRQGPGLQGHAGQFLAIVAQSHVPADFPVKVGGKDFSIQDLIEYEKADCRNGEELTFKLIGLSHYLDSDAEWTTRDGQTWSIARLIREELKQPILRVAACGGTHRLMGHSYAIYKRRKQGKPMDGQFARAEKFISDYHKYAWSLQNSDGTFSTRWFEGREAKPDLDRRIKTTGHVTEWLAFSLPEEQLTGPRMVKAVTFLVNSLRNNVSHEWEVGPHGHAIHALRIYDRRLFKPHDSLTEPVPIAPATMAETQPDVQPGIGSAGGPQPQLPDPSSAPLQTAVPPSHGRASRSTKTAMKSKSEGSASATATPSHSDAPDARPIERAPSSDSSSGPLLSP